MDPATIEETEKLIIDLEDEYLAGATSGRSQVELEQILDVISNQKLRLVYMKAAAEATIGEEL